MAGNALLCELRRNIIYSASRGLPVTQLPEGPQWSYETRLDRVGALSVPLLFRRSRLAARSSRGGVGCGVSGLSPLAKQNIRNRLRT
jgi:hypothetical protein